MSSVAEPVARRRPGPESRRPRRAVALPRGLRRPLVLALAVYAAFDFAYFGFDVIPHLARVCACGSGSDPTSYMWFLAWWPHALLHGADPFTTHALFAPDQINLGAVGLVPGPALLSAPVTLLFGPVVTYNLLALAGPLLAALAAFALCRYITASTPAALVGGYVYGFSPWMLGHMLGHLDLVTTFPIPLSVLLMLVLIDERISRRRFIALMALTLAFQFLTQPELTLMLGLLGGCSLLVALALARGERRRVLRSLLPLLGAAVLAGAVTSVFLYEALTGEVFNPFFANYSNVFVADALGFFFPTAVVRLGRTWFKAVASAYTGNIAEDGVYVGVLLSAVLVRHLVTRWASVATRILAVMLALVVILMLGPSMHIDGNPTISLPWRLLERLPLLDHSAPVRLGVFMYLLIGIAVAGWLSRPRRGWRGVGRWAVAVLAVITLAPNIGTGMWHTRLHNPLLFRSAAYRAVIARGSTVLALPFANYGQSMLWQAETGFYFKMADGYVGALMPPDFVQEIGWPRLNDPGIIPLPPSMRQFIITRHVRTVVVDAAEGKVWRGIFTALGLQPLLLDGALIYQIPPAWFGTQT